MVECRKCNQLKKETEFSKCKANKNGLQYQCKSCNKTSNLKFRSEINPSHHAEWQRTNYKRLLELVRKYRRADKKSLIYSIRNPEGETYIGMTEMYLSVRTLEHRHHYKRALKGQRDRLPGLHDSFDKWGWDTHQFEKVVEFDNMDRKQLKFIETSFIKSFQQIGKSLNIRIN